MATKSLLKKVRKRPWMDDFHKKGTEKRTTGSKYELEIVYIEEGARRCNRAKALDV